MAKQSEYFQEGAVAYARWAATDWKAPRQECPYVDGPAATEWRKGWRHWFDIDYVSPRKWTEEAIERIRK